MKFKIKKLTPKVVACVTCSVIWASAMMTGTVQAEATVYHHARSISFVAYNNDGGQLNVSGPGVSVSKSYDSSGTMSFDAVDEQGYPLPDGYYNYELELTALDYQADMKAMHAAQASGDEAAYAALAERLQANDYSWQTQSGHFYIVNGLIKQPANPGASDE